MQESKLVRPNSTKSLDPETVSSRFTISLSLLRFPRDIIKMAAQKQTDYVTLVSSDGFEFVVKRSCATVAGAIKRMLDPSSTIIYQHSVLFPDTNHATDNFAESRTNRCVFENIK